MMRLTINTHQFLRSLKYACTGIRYCFNSGQNFRILIICIILSNAFSFFFHIPAAYRIWFLILNGLLLCMEMLNTAIETLCDHLHPAIHPAIGRVKDIAAGMVLLFAIVNLGFFLLMILHLLHK